MRSLFPIIVAAAMGAGCTGGGEAPEAARDSVVEAVPTATPEPTPTPRPPETLELEGGVVAEVTEWGTGSTAGVGDGVRMYYVLRTEEGEELDKRGEEAGQNGGGVFEVVLGDSAALPGLTQVLTQLPVGSKATVTLPPAAAFGDLGYGEAIAPGTTLVMELEVLEVVPGP